MDNGKTVAERLREIDVSRPACWGLFINEAMGEKEYPSCPEKTEDMLACDICWGNQLRKLADAIEAEQERTKTEYDGVDVDALLKLADHFEHLGDTHKWYAVQVPAADLHLWKANIRNAVKGLNPSKSTGLRKPDTQEALEVDAAKDACEYFNGEENKPLRCSDCPIGSDEDTDWNHCMKAQKLDMLRRQRELMGGE